MAKVKTYLDSGVLITLARGTSDLETKVLNLLADPQRIFVSSMFLKLEVLPKPICYNNHDELRLYNGYFKLVQKWYDNFKRLSEESYRIACNYGLGGVDALHLASAILLKADEFITTEHHQKPMYKVKEVKVISLLNI